MIFLALTFGFLFGLHFVFYSFIVRFLEVHNPWAKLSIGILFFLLAISFILASILARLDNNIFTKGFYFFSSFWLGFIINMAMALVLILFSVWIFEVLEWGVKVKFVNIFFISLALLFSVYGVYKAFNPQINRVNISLDNLPDTWDEKQIVQLSDIHLGSIYDEKFLEKTIQRVNAINPEIIFITGDLFDGSCENPQRFTAELAKLKANRGVYFVLGNHESYINTKDAKTAIEDAGIRILDNEFVELDGLNIVGISYPGLKRAGLFEQENQDFSKEKPGILLYHIPSSIIEPKKDKTNASAYFSPDIDFEPARDLGIKLQLSGHTHGGQIFPFNLLTKYLFKGYYNGLVTQDDFQIYINPATGTWGPPMRTIGESEITLIRLNKK